jgi:YfiH family protein
MVRMRQVHGADVRVIDQPWLDERPADLPEVDGLVTDLPGVALLVRAADCVPVVLADPERGVVGAAHAGRDGLVAGVVPATVGRMRDLGGERVVAWVGPHICGRCYEVPERMRAEVAATVPESFAETSWGTPAVDVGAGVLAQLRAADVEVVDVARCTRESDDLHSYRRDGARAGRLGGVVWVRP